MDNKKLAKAAGALMIITIMSKVVGFFRDSLIAGAFGATYQTDAYNIAITIPLVVYGLFGGAITTTFIPLLSESYSREDIEDTKRFTNTVINILMIFSIMLFLLSQIFTPQIVKLIAPKFKGDTFALTMLLTRISVVNIVFITINSIFAAILQTTDEFVIPALLGFITSLPVIVYIIFGAHFGIVGLTVVMVIGTLFQVMFQIPWLVKRNFRFIPRIDFRDSRLKKMLLLIGPILLGSGVNQINILVDRNMASGLPEGSIASLGFANILNNLVSNIFITAIVTVIYPTLSRVAANPGKEFKNLISRAINNINLVVLPAAVGLMVLRVPIISVLFGYGKFDERAVYMTSGALLFYSIGLIFIGIRDVAGKAFYAMQDTKTPMINAVIGIFFNIILNILLVKSMGIRGLALATSISAIICALLLILSLSKRLRGINGTAMVRSGVKTLISAGIMGIVIFVINMFISDYAVGRMLQAVWLFGTILVGIVVYFLALVVLKVNEFEEIKRVVIAKLIKRNV